MAGGGRQARDTDAAAIVAARHGDNFAVRDDAGFFEGEAPYRAAAARHARGREPEGFQWIVADVSANSVLAWLRFGEAAQASVLAVSNFTPMPRSDYRIGLPLAGRWRELMNTDAALYGGSTLGNLGGILADSQASQGLRPRQRFCCRRWPPFTSNVQG